MGKWIVLSFAILLADWAAGAVDPQEALRILNSAEALYRAHAEKAGARFRIETRESPLEVASADNTGSEMKVTVHRGLLTSARLTEDGLRFILCHELGHIFGGAPRRGVPVDWQGPIAPDGLSLLSSEGQADYYASRVCFRELVQGQDHVSELRRNHPERVTPRLARLCNSAWGRGRQESQVCLRAALGGNVLLQLVKDFPISFETPDLSSAPSLIRDTYPGRQCRLDTIVAGAVCTVRAEFAGHPAEREQNDCAGVQEAARPRCWYQ